MDGYTLLYSEDDPDLASLMIPHFEEAGYTVLHAANGQEAYNIYLEHSPQIILLDITMPILSGMQVAEKIREADKVTPILLLTGITDSKTAVNGFGIGINDYIRKDCATNEIIARINRHKQIAEGSFDSGIYKITAECLLDINNQLLIVHGNTIPLSANECKVMKILGYNKNNIVDRKSIMVEIWETPPLNSKIYLNKLLSRLRCYLKEEPNINIMTYRQRGIKLEVRLS